MHRCASGLSSKQTPPIPFQTKRRNSRHAATRSTQLRSAPAGRADPASLFLLAFPIMGGNILQIAYQLVDAFWVGRLGAAAVAAVSVRCR